MSMAEAKLIYGYSINKHPILKVQIKIVKYSIKFYPIKLQFFEIFGLLTKYTFGRFIM